MTKADSCGHGKHLRTMLASQGIDAHVTTTPPLVQGYEPLNMSCPCGTPWYAEPTGEQRVAWARTGTT